MTTTPVAYTVIATIADEATAQEWLGWLRHTHITDVLKGGATRAEIIRLDDDQNRGNGAAKTYEIRYLFDNRGTFEHYLETTAPRLRAEGLERFPPEAGITYRRTIGDILLQQ